MMARGSGYGGGIARGEDAKVDELVVPCMQRWCDEDEGGVASGQPGSCLYALV